MADQKNEESSSESEIDTNRDQPRRAGAQTKVDNNHLSVQTATVLEGSSSQGALSGGSTGGKSTENLNNANDLPEDKEIQSSSEDEM